MPRPVGSEKRANALLERVKSDLAPGPGTASSGNAFDLRDADGNLMWVWGVSVWGGSSLPRLQPDVFVGQS